MLRFVTYTLLGSVWTTFFMISSIRGFLLLSELTMFFGIYRTFKYIWDDDGTRDSRGYRIIGRSGGYNPLYYVDYSDYKPTHRSLTYEFL